MFNLDKDYYYTKMELYKQRRILKRRLKKTYWVLSLVDMKILVYCMKIINRKTKGVSNG